VATTLVSPAQLRELSNQLRAGGHGELAKELRKAVRDASQPVVADVRSAWLRMVIRGEQGSVGVFAPTRGGGGRQRTEHAQQRIKSARLAARKYSGLRQAVASATRARNLARGVTIEVDRTRFPRHWDNLPQSLESRRGWRHPLFGNREHWYGERGEPTFYPTVRRNQPRFHAAVAAAMDSAGRKLAEKVGGVL
jgi:hypothetical protein